MGAIVEQHGLLELPIQAGHIMAVTQVPPRQMITPDLHRAIGPWGSCSAEIGHCRQGGQGH